jgi:tRNA threonylcarbamoyladenosine modification (KEOPS) complex  Pcc1 subunit
VISSKTEFKVKDSAVAQKIISSIKPDMEFDAGRKRSRVSLSAEGDTLVLEIEAKDVAAFRATLNTYTRSIEVSKGLIEDDKGST